MYNRLYGMLNNIQDSLGALDKNVVIFIAAMFVGIMAYTGDPRYTPIVLLLLLFAAGIDKYGSE